MFSAKGHAIVDTRVITSGVGSGRSGLGFSANGHAIVDKIVIRGRVREKCVRVLVQKDAPQLIGGLG